MSLVTGAEKRFPEFDSAESRPHGLDHVGLSMDVVRRMGVTYKLIFSNNE